MKKDNAELSAEERSASTTKGKIWIRDQDTGALTEVDEKEYKTHPSRFKNSAPCMSDGSPIENEKPTKDAGA